MLLLLLLGLGWLWRSAARRDIGDSNSARPLAAALDQPRSAVASRFRTGGACARSLEGRLGGALQERASLHASSTTSCARWRGRGSSYFQEPRARRPAPTEPPCCASRASRASCSRSRGRADGHVAARVEQARTRRRHVPRRHRRGARRCARGFVGDDLGQPIAGRACAPEIIGSRWKGVSTPPLGEARYVETLQSDALLALTGADGRYRFDALPRSFVRAWASADGYTTEWSDDVSIALQETTQAPAFALRQPPPSGASRESCSIRAARAGAERRTRMRARLAAGTRSSAASAA
jgi:hypothetical protein